MPLNFDVNIEALKCNSFLKLMKDRLIKLYRTMISTESIKIKGIRKKKKIQIRLLCYLNRLKSFDHSFSTSVDPLLGSKRFWGPERRTHEIPSLSMRLFIQWLFSSIFDLLDRMESSHIFLVEWMKERTNVGTHIHSTSFGAFFSYRALF